MTGPSSGGLRWLAHPYVILTAATVTWAGNAIAGRLIVGEVSPMAVACLRWLIALSALSCLFGRRVWAERAEVVRHWRSFLVLGAVGYTLFNATFYLSAHYTTAINIGLVQGIVPAVVVFGSFLAYRTPIGKAQIAGLVLALGGVAVAASHGDLEQLRRLEFNKGDLMLAVASVAYAGFVVALKRPIPVSQEVAFCAMAAAALLTSLPLIGWEVATGTVQWPTRTGWAIMVYIALVPSLLSQLLLMRGVAMIGPARAGLFMNLIPVFAAVLAVLLLGETFALYHAVALAMVLGGIALAEAGRLSAVRAASGRSELEAVAPQQAFVQGDDRDRDRHAQHPDGP